ncbi:hypothetical protein KC340_g136 [Hortaea werneckii]|nr:hypothetical protein KC340_g136 [Hortaea werneckii]
MARSSRIEKRAAVRVLFLVAFGFPAGRLVVGGGEVGVGGFLLRAEEGLEESRLLLGVLLFVFAAGVEGGFLAGGFLRGLRGRSGGRGSGRRVVVKLDVGTIQHERFSPPR